MRGKNIRALGSLVLAVGVCLGAEAGTSARPALWSADLQEFSYGLRPSPRYIGGMPYAGRNSDVGLLFRSPTELICYFLIRKQPGELVQRQQTSGADPFQVQVVSLDSGTGKVRYDRELPGRFGDATLMVNDQRNFIVRSGELLRLYTSGFEVVKERKLETGEYDHWSLRISPTARTLLLKLKQYKPVQTYVETLNSSSLVTLASGQDNALSHRFALSDNSLAATDEVERRVLFRRFNEPWGVVWDGKNGRCVPVPAFITNSQLLVLCGHEAMVMTTAGQITMHDELEGGKKEYLEELLSVTQDGRFFAVSAEQTRGGFMDYTNIKRSRTRILIYDTALQKRIASVQVDPIPKKDYDFALAPDGSKLAVMIDSQLKAYAIQPQKLAPRTDTLDPKTGNLHLTIPNVPANRSSKGCESGR